MSDGAIKVGIQPYFFLSPEIFLVDFFRLPLFFLNFDFRNMTFD